MARLLGIDVGTSGCKALLVDETGHVLRQANAEYPLSSPQPGWSEQNPEAWWLGVQACLAEIGENPDAIGLTGQMHGSVFLDAEDNVVRPALLWNDQRTAQQCEEIKSRVGLDRVVEITKNPPLTGFQLPKILWLREHEPSAFASVKSVLLPKDFVRLKLTGERATEPSDASGTGMLDVADARWSDEISRALDLDLSLFPQLVGSSEVAGKTKDGVPVVGGGGDQAAGAAGTGAVVPGVTSVSLGTSGVAFVAKDQPDADPTGSTHTFCHVTGRWHRMGVMLSCGGALRWFRDIFAPGTPYDVLAAAAAATPPGAEGLTFLPYLTGERCPHNDPELRAAFVGATVAHSFGHFARAVFEGATFGVLDCLGAVDAPPGVVRLSGGGAKGAFWAQMVADASGRRCATLKADEGPAFGAALLAGVGIGVWRSIEEAAAATVREDRYFDSSESDYSVAYHRFKSVMETARSTFSL